ncbi:MAG: Nitric oxide reductase [bacterium ADurb.Bin429]|nr:MAG: Nitric oxide reductase [bacterium ADurb.Bin429]
MITELAHGVYWVGVTDWNLRHFHGHEYSTHSGTTYNAYLIVDDRTVLVDTVWEPFAEDLLANIREIVDPAQIDFVIANHGEIDHAGGLPLVMREAANAEIVVSKRGAHSIEGYYHQPWRFRTVCTGDRMQIGAHELVFIEAPMLHWPDSMFTYLTGHHLLFSNDAFGQHYASAGHFNDDVDQHELYGEALKYYANILTPFSDLVLKKIDEILALNLPVEMIAPAHGVIWRADPLQIVTQYQTWARQMPEPRAVVVYDTMWQATRRMAEAIGEGLLESGVNFTLQNLAVTDRNDVLAEIFRVRLLVVGSPTMNRGILPSLSPLLTDLKGLRFKHKLGAAFGSYGWHAESVTQIEAHLSQCGISVIQPGITCQWQPSDDDLTRCRQFGRDLGEAVRQPLLVEA